MSLFPVYLGECGVSLSPPSRVAESVAMVGCWTARLPVCEWRAWWGWTILFSAYSPL